MVSSHDRSLLLDPIDSRRYRTSGSLPHRHRIMPSLRFIGLFLAIVTYASAAPPPEGVPLGAGIGGIAYWSRGLFANTQLTAHEWLDYRGNEFGSEIRSWNQPQFNANGYPQYLLPGQKLRTLMWPFNANPSNRPSSWPRRDREGLGRVVLTWQGEADLRLTGATFLAADSSGAATGLLRNGRRVYLNNGINLPSLTVEAITPEAPLTDIKVWLPDPVDPINRSLEGQRWHPNPLSRLRDLPFGHLRMMDLGETNQSPQQDWSDRRLPSHRTMHGKLNPRSPGPGVTGNRATGMAWELMVDLANTLDRDLWICVPHLATDDYVQNLARLVRFGSDGENPYTGPQTHPVHPPLAPHLRLWVEYSNEIWSSGNSFPQGDWAQAEGAKLGLSKAEFNARRFSQIWRTFQEVWGGSERIVRVAAIFTANASYTEPFLRELARYGPTLSPAVAPDVISPTTYFGNGIQEWAYETALRRRGSTHPWFLTAQDFTGASTTRPASVPPHHPYWISPQLSADLIATAAEWKRRIFSGSTAQGSGPDATGLGGGFSATLVSTVNSIFGRTLPLVAYEGGPSLYTDNRDGGDARDDGITTFMEALNRRPEMGELLALHLNLAKAKGLHSNTIFVDVSQWGKYGQWGHLEYPDQRPQDSTKWQALRDHDSDFRGLRSVLAPLGQRPQFETAPRLPSGFTGQPYLADVVVTPGEDRSGHGPKFTVVSRLLDPGLSTSVVPGSPATFRVSGTPLGNGTNYFLLRVADDDGDAAWRIFSFEIGGGPGVFVQSRFEGTDPIRHLPWTATFAVQSGITFSGWRRGDGLVPQSGNDGLVFSLNAPADKAQATLARALTSGEYFTCTLTPGTASPLNLQGAELRFAIRRDSFHAPRQWALLTSVAGFEATAAVFTSGENTSQNETIEYEATLPSTAPYGAVSSPIEIRLVPFAGQYSQHPAALLAFRLTRAGSTTGFGASVPGSTGRNRLINLSSRGVAASGANAMVAGFALRGSHEKRVLLRGVGPALRDFGLSNALAEANLHLYTGSTLLRTNAGWDQAPDAAEVARVSAQVQAFPLPGASRDAALLVTLSPGNYTAHLSPARAEVSPGVALIEVYDADGGTETRFVNLSTRADAGPGSEALIVGFVIAGDGTQRLLLRGVGPGLEAFGVAASVSNPFLALFSGQDRIDANDDWFLHPARLQLTALSAASGAFALGESSRDAALLVQQAPGGFTLHLTPADSRRAVALVELYVTP